MVTASPCLSPHQSPCRALGCKIRGDISTICTPEGLSWGLSPGFSWGGANGGKELIVPWVPGTVAAPFALEGPGLGFHVQRV